jgi:hypothetical protein
MSRGEVRTMVVLGPTLREKISPYCLAHSVNLFLCQYQLVALVLLLGSLQVRPLRGDLV